jgi:hypothetical protein
MPIATLSARINLEQTRKQAKELLKAFKAGDRKILDHVRWNHPRFKGLTDKEIAAGKFQLADAQLVLARLHAFDSWPKLLEHIEALENKDPAIMRFENAADAIVGGDIPTLEKLLRDNPELIHARATRSQRAPLIHYVAANGIEGYRQVTPPNIIEVATVLLDAGAEVDAVSDAYGGGSTTLALVATSAHPRRAGVQIPLMDFLLSRGAAIEGMNPRLTIVAGALANGCPEAARALVERGARVEDVATAAGVGRLDLVMRLAPDATKPELEKALVMAGWYGTIEIIEFLLDRGVDVAAFDGMMTALHSAAGRANLAMTNLLIERGAPLERKNSFGGTVLDSTLWFAYNSNPEDLAARDYPTIIDMLLAAGARDDLYPKMKEYIDEIYRRGGRERGVDSSRRTIS